MHQTAAKCLNMTRCTWLSCYYKAYIVVCDVGLNLCNEIFQWQNFLEVAQMTDVTQPMSWTDKHWFFCQKTIFGACLAELGNQMRWNLKRIFISMALIRLTSSRTDNIRGTFDVLSWTTWPPVSRKHNYRRLYPHPFPVVRARWMYALKRLLVTRTCRVEKIKRKSKTLVLFEWLKMPLSRSQRWQTAATTDVKSNVVSMRH